MKKEFIVTVTKINYSLEEGIGSFELSTQEGESLTVCAEKRKADALRRAAWDEELSITVVFEGDCTPYVEEVVKR